MPNKVHPFDRACELLETRLEIELTTVRDFTKAYKSYARQNHPDKQGDEVDDEFQNLTNFFNRIRLLEPDMPLDDLAWSEDGDGDDKKWDYANQFLDGPFVVSVFVEMRRRDDIAALEQDPQDRDREYFDVLTRYIDRIEAIPVQEDDPQNVSTDGRDPDLSANFHDELNSIRIDHDEYEAAGDLDNSLDVGEDNEEGMDSGHESDDAMDISDNSSGGDRAMAQNSCHAYLVNHKLWYCGNCDHKVAKVIDRPCRSCGCVVAELKKNGKPQRPRCSYCQKQFRYAAEVKVHERIHTGTRPFTCSHCQMSFTIHQNLNRHFLVHTGDRQHKCDRCNASFKRQDKLKEHMQLHKSNKAT